MPRKPKPITVTLALDYDGFKDLERALLDGALKALDDEHEAPRDRLNRIRYQIEDQVKAQRPRW